MSSKSKRVLKRELILNQVSKINSIGKNLKPKNWGRESEKKKDPWKNFSDRKASQNW